MTSEVDVYLPEKLIPIFQGHADVRGSHGGRGSGKTRSFATMTAVMGYKFGMSGITGQIVCGRQFMNSLDDSSLEEIKRSIASYPFLSAYYEVGEKYIKSRDGRIKYTFVGLDRNVESVKSKGRILILWVDEAEPVTDEAFKTLEPTLREESDNPEESWNAELWLTWNSKRKNAAVEKRYRNSTDPLVKIVELNYTDNKKFPAKLERQRLRDLAERPEEYNHIWEGGFAEYVEGAYYSKHLLQAKEQGRITNLAVDPLHAIRVFCDLGGTGARADAFTMWVAQFIGMRINALHYYEAQGQELSVHVDWLRSNGYGKANIWLPHDGAQNEKLIDSSFEKAFQQAGFPVVVVPNQGRGAAKQRVEVSKRRFPMIYFDDKKTEAGRYALGFYHEKRDEKRDIGLGPEHDWSSHGADSFGLMNLVFQEPAQTLQPINYKRRYLA